MREKKEPLRPETFFLPPLKMILAFFDRESRERDLQRKAAEEKKELEEKQVVKLIEKLNEKD
jgi:hypothetical protein